MKEALLDYMDNLRLDGGWVGYTCQHHTLGRLGFGCYEEYLASGLWKAIEHRQLFASQWKCDCCHEAAVAVFCSSREMDILGGRLWWRDLHPLCVGCFREVAPAGAAAESPADVYRVYVRKRDAHQSGWTRKRHEKANLRLNDRVKLFKQQFPDLQKMIDENS